MMRIILFAIAVAFVAAFASDASAEVRITNDPGGEVSSFVTKYRDIARHGEQIVIDGPCISACTLFTGLVPRNKVCVTARAELGFHMATYYDDATRSFIPSREGTRMVVALYPPAIRRWIKRHGALTAQVRMLRGPELRALYRSCQ